MSVRNRNGKYHYRYSIIDPQSGKRKQKETKGFKTAREARQEGIRIQSEILNGTYIEEKDITYLEWVDKWLEMLETRSIRPVKNSTVRIRRNSLNTTKKYFTGLKLRDVTKKAYQDMLIDLKNKGYARRTICLVHEAAPQMFAKAVDLELIKNNPTVGAEVPSFQQTVEQLKNRNKIPKFMEKNELKLFLQTVKKHGTNQEYTAFYLLAFTGMRIGEMCALEKEDIDLKEKTIRIYKTLHDGGKYSNFGLNTPKTISSEREVVISDNVKKELELHFAWKNEYKMLRRNEYYNDRDFVFINVRQYPGYPESAKRFGQRMKIYLELAGLPSTLSPHSLRHTHVSLLAEAGVPLEHIQERMGHENDRVTREIYLHVTEEKKKEAPEKFEQLMGDF